MSFKAGDVVELKSGGPDMTVEKVGTHPTGGPRVWVTWFDGNKKCSDTFAPAALKLSGTGKSADDNDGDE